MGFEDLRCAWAWVTGLELEPTVVVSGSSNSSNSGTEPELSAPTDKEVGEPAEAIAGAGVGASRVEAVGIAPSGSVARAGIGVEAGVRSPGGARPLELRGGMDGENVQRGDWQIYKKTRRGCWLRRLAPWPFYIARGPCILNR